MVAACHRTTDLTGAEVSTHMQVFPDDSQDSVERLYAQEILKNFPNYRRFWQELVGQRADPRSGTFRPYGLAFPDSMDKRQRNRCERDYELLCMQSYSVFVHLAGAHYQLREMAQALSLSDESSCHFLHWEAYDVGLLHLGTALSLAKGLVTQVSRVTEHLHLMSDLLCHRLWTGLDRAVRLPRNDVVHYSRRLHRRNSKTGAFEVLREPFFQSRRAWSQDLLLAADDSKWTRAEDQLTRDVVDTETLLNDVWGWIVDALLSHYDRLGVRVCYEQAMPSARPLPLTTGVDTAQTPL